nr:ABC transporter B family member 26, chloroplastic-like [Ziziphus jujuba var. spinosa]
MGPSSMCYVHLLLPNFFIIILAGQDIIFFGREGVGDLTSMLRADCQQLSDIIGHNINLMLRNVLQGTGALINLLMLSWPLALSALLMCSLLNAIFVVCGKYQKKAAKVTQDFTAGANEVAQEGLSLMRIVRVYGAERKELGRFLAVLFGEMSMLSGHISAEQLTKYVLTWRVTDNVSSLLQSVGASEKFLQLMDFCPVTSSLQKSLLGHIQFLNISFYYPTTIKVPVLDRVNLSIHPNEVVAIVGPSGGGKSTLTYLLLHLYEPINGQNFSQAHVLVSIEKNYAPFGDFNCLYMNYGDPKQKLPMKGNIKQEDIEQAAKLAYAHDFILSLANGYETLVDDNLLSGGQKQRIAIARAILRNPSILILDEATSALDSQSEDYGVLHEFKNDIKAKRTVIIIAHSGRVIEVGDHAELIRKDGLYSRLS